MGHTKLKQVITDIKFDEISFDIHMKMLCALDFYTFRL